MAVKLPIYMDHNATTPADPRVVEAMLPYFTDIYGNVGSVSHSFGWQAKEAVDQARATLATAVGATAVGPSLPALKEYPQLVDRSAAQGRAVYCWNVDEYEDIDFCREVGVAWIATHHPGRTKTWLQDRPPHVGSG